MDKNKIVKCACGLTMRQKDWAGHWNGCYKGASVPVTEKDEKDLLWYEEYQREQDKKHKEWLASRK